MKELVLQNSHIASLQAFFAILDLRHKDTAAHSILVSSIAVEIGLAMGLEHDQLEQLYIGALLHDIGKLAIPNTILDKPAKLDKSELGLVRQHPEIGYRLLGDISNLSDARNVVLYHHERYDGHGYPCGLTGEAIPPLARICSVADALAAMLIERPYKSKVNLPTALSEIQACRGTQFDPQVVDTLPLCNLETVFSSPPTRVKNWHPFDQRQKTFAINFY